MQGEWVASTRRVDAGAVEQGEIDGHDR